MNITSGGKQMLKWKEQNGKITANRAWIMTEAWVIVNRFKKMGQSKPIGDAMRSAWLHAKDEVGVQISARGHMGQIKELSRLGADRLRAMVNDIENIDRHSRSDAKRLSDVRQAINYA